MKDVILIDPTEIAWSVGLNILEYETDWQRHFLIQDMVGTRDAKMVKTAAKTDCRRFPLF
jgi:hypothetical protein